MYVNIHIYTYPFKFTHCIYPICWAWTPRVEEHTDLGNEHAYNIAMYTLKLSWPIRTQLHRGYLFKGTPRSLMVSGLSSLLLMEEIMHDLYLWFTDRPSKFFVQLPLNRFWISSIHRRKLRSAWNVKYSNWLATKTYIVSGVELFGHIPRHAMLSKQPTWDTNWMKLL